MALGVGDIVAKVGLDSAPFSRGIAKVQRETGGLARHTSVVGRQMSGRWTGAMNQLSYATDDMLGVLGAGGSFSQGLRATANNIGTLVTTINPVAGILTTIGLAAGTSLVSAFESAGDASHGLADDTESAMDRIDDSLTKAERRFEDFHKERRRRRGVLDFGGVGNVGAELDKRITASRRKIEGDRVRVGVYNRALAEQQAKDPTTMSPEQRDNRREVMRRIRVERDKALAAIEKEAALQHDIVREAERQKRLNAERTKAERRAREQQEKRQERERQEADRQRQMERQQRDHARAAERIHDIEMNLQSSLLKGEAKRRFDIKRTHEERAKGITQNAASFSEMLPLLGLNTLSEQRELQGEGGGPTQFAGAKLRGSSEAFSEILRASGVAADKKAEEKKIAKSNAEIQKNTKAMSDALKVADSLLIIPSLGGAT